MQSKYIILKVAQKIFIKNVKLRRGIYCYFTSKGLNDYAKLSLRVPFPCNDPV